MVESLTGPKSQLSLNPLKRVNSILTGPDAAKNADIKSARSQSPQTGQFNSYGVYYVRR